MLTKEEEETMGTEKLSIDEIRKRNQAGEVYGPAPSAEPAPAPDSMFNEPGLIDRLRKAQAEIDRGECVEAEDLAEAVRKLRGQPTAEPAPAPRSDVSTWGFSEALSVLPQIAQVTESPAPTTKSELIDWLVQWRQDMKGSISPENHRKLLNTRTKAQLQHMYEQIRSQAGQPGAAPEGREPGVLDEILLKLQRRDYGSRPTAPAMIMTALQAAYSAGKASRDAQIEAERAAHEAIADILLPLVGTDNGTSIGAARKAAEALASAAEREKELRRTIESDGLVSENRQERYEAAVEREKRLREALRWIEEQLGTIPVEHMTEEQGTIYRQARAALSEVSAEQEPKT